MISGHRSGLTRLSCAGRRGCGRALSQFVGALDQGTSSTRFMIFDKAGHVVSMKQMEHQQYFPAAGQVEHCPQEIWHNSQAVIRDGLSAAGLTSADIAGLGITNQRETTIAWNKHTGEPYHNALVWNDTRTADICDSLAAEKGGDRDRFRASTGLPLSPYFSASKMMYLLDKVPGLREAGERGDALFGTVDSFLIWKLTGGGSHTTDVTNASRTLLMNLKTIQWDDDILAATGIPRAMLPAIHPSSGTIDTVSVAAETALDGVPISGVLGDQQAALFGQACFEPGQVKSTYGTGCFLLMNTGTRSVPSNSGLLTTVAYQMGDGTAPVYALEGSVAYSGSTIQWLRDNLQVVGSAGECEAMAATVEDNGGVYFVPAFAGLYAPYWRSDARGIIAGLTAYNTKYHVVRAALEATAFQAYEVIEAMDSDCVANGLCDNSDRSFVKSMKVDGGASQNSLLMQFQSDLLEAPLYRPSVHETTALGAAFAAGLGVGFWPDEAAVGALWKEDRQWSPAMGQEQRADYLRGWKKAIQKSLNWTD